MLALAATAVQGFAFGPACAERAVARSPMETWINPVDLDYKYNFEQTHQGVSYRTGADPAVVRFGDEWFLFLTLADGYWRSKNLHDWTFVRPNLWPFESNVAPSPIVAGGKLYLMQSSYEPRPLLSSTDPASGRFEFEARILPPIPGALPPGQEDRVKDGQLPPGPWDPQLFRDDDGRWYLFWGSSNVFPLYGMEVDPKTWTWKGAPRPMLLLQPEKHGWERFGPDHSGGLPDGTPIRPYMEGAWVTKHRGRYYLQYGAPGTEYNAYATGTYVADSPLGPYRYAPYNPVSYKPGGFVTGAGHGSTFQDEHGNWWNTGTPWLGLNWTFERRVALFPAGFESDGQMFAVTRFGDFPHWRAKGRENPKSLFTGWMLLSRGKATSASSVQNGAGPERAVDENPRTFWAAGSNKAGEHLTVDLGGARTVRAVQVNFADYRAGRYGDAPDVWTSFRLSHSLDGRTWAALAEVPAAVRRDRPNAYLPLPEPVRTRFVRYEHGYVGAANLAIGDLRVFGNAPGRPPPPPRAVHAVRLADQRDGDVRWTAVPGAVGYNVRWGVRPDRLHQTYQVWADGPPRLELRALTVGQAYWVAVESFDEVGVSTLSKAVPLR